MHSRLVLVFLLTVSLARGQVTTQTLPQQILGVLNFIFGGIQAIATESTQSRNNAELVAANITLAAQLAKQAAMLADMVRQAKLTGANFGSIALQLQTLGQIVQYGQAIAYSQANVDQIYQARYPGYNVPVFMPIGGGTWPGQYNIWSRTVLDTITATLRHVQLANSYQNSDGMSMLSAAEGAMSFADGRNQELQAMSQIADNETQELHRLQALMMADIQSKAAYMGYRVQTDATQQAASEQFFQLAHPVGDGWAPPLIGSVRP